MIYILKICFLIILQKKLYFFVQLYLLDFFWYFDFYKTKNCIDFYTKKTRVSENDATSLSFFSKDLVIKMFLTAKTFGIVLEPICLVCLKVSIYIWLINCANFASETCKFQVLRSEYESLHENQQFIPKTHKYFKFLFL